MIIFINSSREKIVGSSSKLLRRWSAASMAARTKKCATIPYRNDAVLRKPLPRIQRSALSCALLWTCCYSCCVNSFSRCRPPIFPSNGRTTNNFDPSPARFHPATGNSNSLFLSSFVLSASKPPIHSQSNKRFSSASSDNTDDDDDDDYDGKLSVELLANELAKSNYSKIIALVGAGASCSAGIPDFRTPGTGLYDQLSEYNLPFPEAIFDLGYYKNNPMPFVDLCKAIWPGQESGPKPTLSHTFLKLLEEKNLLHRIYTQNIDGLEALAGVSTDKLVECHGHFRSSSCVACKTRMPIDDCQRTVVERGAPPTCQSCGSLVKPDVVFFGEEMPSRFCDLIDSDVEECDLLLILGTSLMVMPVAGIPSWVSPKCPRVLLNRELAGGIGIGSGRGARSKTDLFLKGDCDDTVRNLCDLAGWTKDLEALREAT